EKCREIEFQGLKIAGSIQGGAHSVHRSKSFGFQEIQVVSELGQIPWQTGLRGAERIGQAAIDERSGDLLRDDGCRRIHVRTVLRWFRFEAGVEFSRLS